MSMSIIACTMSFGSYIVHGGNVGGSEPYAAGYFGNLAARLYSGINLPVPLVPQTKNGPWEHYCYTCWQNTDS